MTTPRGPATQSSGNPGGFLNVGWSGTNQTAIVGPAGSLVPFGAMVGIYDGAGNSITSGSALFSNANNVSFGIAGNTLTASVVVGGGVALYDGANSISSGTAQFSNANGVTFGFNGQTITASIAAAGGAQTAISGVVVSNATYTSGTISFSNANGISFGSSAGQAITASYTVPGNPAFSAQGGSSTFQTLAFTNSNNVSFSNTAGSIWGSFGLNVSATGGTSNALSGLTLQDGNGVSFGLSTGAGVGTLTASVAAQSNQTGGIYFLTNTVGDSSSSTYDLRSLSITFQSAGILTGGWTNGTLQLGARFKMSAGASSANVQAVTFSNSNNVSFGMQTGALVGTFTGSYALNVSATGGTSNALSGLTFQNSNGVSFGLSTGAGVGSLTASVAAQSTQPVAYSAANGSANFSTLSFSNVNNVSFATAAGPAIQGSFALNVSATGGTSQALSGLTFRDSNGVSFGLSTGAGIGSITASIATTYAGTGVTTGSTTGALSGTLNTSGLSLVVPYLTRYIWPEGNLAAVTAPGIASQTIQYVPVVCPITGTRIDALVGMSNSSSAGAGTVTLQFSQYAIIYTRNVSTLSSLSSGSTQTTYTYASNTNGATYLTNSALYPISVPINFNLVPGEYFVGFNIVTANTAGSATISMIGGNQIATASNYAEFANTATSTNLFGGMGIYSAATTGVVTRVSLSAINQTGSALSAANIALVFRNA